MVDEQTATIAIATAAIMVTIFGTAIALARAINPGIRDLRKEVTNLRQDLGERVARIEGILHSHGMNGGGRRISATDEMPKELSDKFGELCS
ncbi:MAG: hypothetical protein OXD33_08140 [Rhodobacteraceae bacterium]|nr:hypothetical protein [Paracoccaceae bacterium]